MSEDSEKLWQVSTMDLLNLRQAVNAKRLNFNRYDMRWSTESKVNWESFNLAIDIASDEISDFINRLRPMEDAP